MTRPLTRYDLTCFGARVDGIIARDLRTATKLACQRDPWFKHHRRKGGTVRVLSETQLPNRLDSRSYAPAEDAENDMVNPTVWRTA